jgi:catechol 2,3-dioxygenase-like lactoylglutathione lyase family enzyme
MKLNHLALAVRDQQRSIEFYAKYFGFDPSTARTYPDGVIIVRDGEGFSLAFGAEGTSQRTLGFPHFGFKMEGPEEVRELRARLVADGAKFLDDEETEAYVGFKCLDPDGHVVEVSWELE